MNKKVIYKIFHPNIFIFFFITIVGFGSVITTFILGLENTLYAYISYLLSSYALIIFIIRCIDLYKIIKKNLYRNKTTSKFLKSKELRDNLGLYSGTFINFLFAIFKILTGFIYGSWWFISNGFYYLVLSLMKFNLSYKVIKKIEIRKKILEYRNTGIFLLLLNITMIGMITLMITKDKTNIYPGFIIYAQAAYTFYILILALINVIKYRKNNTPLIASSKAINLITATMSLFILQTALINTFGGTVLFKNVMNTITGSVVSMLDIGIATYMIYNGNKKLKSL